MISAFLLATASGASVAAASPTPAPIYDNGPHYSPDSTSLAFISNRGGQRQIYVIRTDGTGLTAVPAQVPGSIGSVAWFPSGDLLFTTYESPLATGADDSIGAVRFRRMSASGADGRILYQGMNVERPASSPTGRLLVFEAEHGPFGSHPDIDVMTFDIPTLTARTLTTGGQNVQAAWSPDGTKIAYACGEKTTDELQICLMDADGGHPRAITSGPGSHEWPAWSPDSSRVAYFIAQRIGGVLDCNIATVGDNGGDPVILTRHTAPQRDETPSWSPDGAHIAFQTNRLGSGMRIAVRNADGTNVQMVTK